jgi:SHS2 domain-containing protein
MPYAFIEDSVTSDITFRASGVDLDELFTAAADATTHVMVEAPAEVRPVASRPVQVEADALDLLLLRFLGELIFYKDAEGLILRAVRVHVEPQSGGYLLSAELRGEPLDPARHLPGADPKAVTLHGLRVDRVPSGWEAQVTLDV